MKTYYEIIKGKNFRQLSMEEKEAIQDRQTQLVLAWQDSTDEKEKEEIFDELHASLQGLIKSMAYRKARESISVEQEDFEGLMYLTLVESMIKFDRTREKPFQPVFIYNVENEVRMMYRKKNYDVHEQTTMYESTRLDHPTALGAETPVHPSIELKGQRMAGSTNDVDEIEQMVAVEQILTDLFGNNEVKKTIVHMAVEGFKRNEIISAIQVEGKSTDALARQVNRTVNEFKAHYLNLLKSNEL